MTKNAIVNEYFDWLCCEICDQRYSQDISYRKLLTRLHQTEFIWFVKMDRNRAEDGLDLRYRFSYRKGYTNIYSYLDEPCSILEMMVALAIRCEEQIMDDPAYDDRTGQWFWGMIVNLGLGSMTDDNYDRKYVDNVIWKFLNRKYDRDGKGGLFRVRDCQQDMRKVEIWYQLNYYLDTIT